MRMWVSAEEGYLNSNEIKSKLFLSRDKYGFMACHSAALGGSLESLELLWSWAMKMELNAGDLLLAQLGKTVLPSNWQQRNTT
jgi:hypothetical protein